MSIKSPSLLAKLLAQLNTLHPGWLVFGLITLFFQGWHVDPNGEQYLSYARYHADPAWFPGSYWFDDFPGTRYLFQVVVGWWLKVASFEAVSFFGRLLMAALVAIPLGKLLRRMELSNLAVLVVFQLVWLGNQALYGGETMVGGFETKHLAYLGVLWGLLALLDDRHEEALLWMGVGSLFHLLVGGWMALITGLYLLLWRAPWPRFLRGSLGYLALVAPLLWYLYQGLLSEAVVVNDGPSPDWIYTYYRNPHHTTPFHLGFAHLNRYYLPGLITALTMGIMSLTLWRRLDHPAARRLNVFFWALLIQQLLALSLAWLDREGTLLKTYPFRPMAIMHLIGWLLILHHAEHRWPWPRRIGKRWLRVGQFLLLLAVCLSIGMRLSTHTWPRLVQRDTQAYRALVAFAKNQTPADAWFAGVERPLPISFMRNSRRNVLVLPKVIPSEKPRIVDWYQRMLARDSLLQQSEAALKVAQRYQIDYLVSPRPRTGWEAWLVFHHGSYWVYRRKGGSDEKPRPTHSTILSIHSPGFLSLEKKALIYHSILDCTAIRLPPFQLINLPRNCYGPRIPTAAQSRTGNLAPGKSAPS